MTTAQADPTHALPGTCHLPAGTQPRAIHSAEALEAALGRLLWSAAGGARPAGIRDRCWTLAEGVRMAERQRTIGRTPARRCFDQLGAAWSYCDRLTQGWRWLDLAEPAEAMKAAARALAMLDDLEPLLPQDADLLPCLRDRAQLLWQLADGLEEAGFLAECGDLSGARERAMQLLALTRTLVEARQMDQAEAELIEDLAARWGARPPECFLDSWAS